MVTKLKKPKSSHPTTKKPNKEITGPLVMDEYYCLKARQPKPVTMSFLRTLADMLIDWAEESDALSIMKFYTFAGIPKQSFYDFMKRCPELKRAYDYAIDVLGARRDDGAMRKKLDPSAVWKTQYRYGQDYKEAMEFAAKLAKKEDLEDQGGAKFIIVEKMVTDKSMEKYFEKKGDQ